LIIIAWIIELFSVVRWDSCWLFKNYFYFTLPTLSARVIDAINLNRATPVLLTHIMHNKIIYLVWGGLQTLLQYWDIRFLKEFVGIIGAIGIMLALWYLFTKFRKNIYIWILFIVCLLLSAIEMFFQPNIIYVWKLFVLGGAFQLLSLFGLWQFLKPKSNRRYLLVAVLLVISALSLIFFPLAYQAFCLKI
jgi:hypothetical protein